MTKEETKKAIEVMQAWVDGELIEARVRGSGKWILVGCDPDWRWDIQDYRIKPEPMETVAWEKDNKLYFPQYHHPDQPWESQGYRRILFREVIE